MKRPAGELGDGEPSPLLDCSSLKKQRTIDPTINRPPSSYIKSYTCSFAGCDKAYTKPSKLEDHIRSHTGDRPFCCSEPDCDKRFLRKSHLQAHSRFHLPKEQRPYLCDAEGCGQRFDTNQHLTQHAAIHTRPKPHICEDCDAAFHKHFQLKAHVAEVHLNSKPCVCPVEGCGASFTYQSILDKHVTRAHDDTKRYCCEIDGCSEKFVKWTMLQTHVKLAHTIKCPYCKKSYLDKDALEAHTATHQLPVELRKCFPCTAEGCDKTFTRVHALQKHVKFAHEGIRDFKCDECDKEFAHKRTLKQHIIREHQTEKVKRKIERSGVTQVSVFDRLTGTGYTETGRHIACIADGCLYRFAREYDFDRHISTAHPELEVTLAELQS